MGENPLCVPYNFFTSVSQVAVGHKAQLQVVRADWPSTDGTGILDYIHVWISQRGTVLPWTAW